MASLQAGAKSLSFAAVGAEFKAARSFLSSSPTSVSLYKLLPTYRPLKQTQPTRHSVFTVASSSVTHDTQGTPIL